MGRSIQQLNPDSIGPSRMSLEVAREFHNSTLREEDAAKRSISALHFDLVM